VRDLKRGKRVEAAIAGSCEGKQAVVHDEVVGIETVGTKKNPQNSDMGNKIGQRDSGSIRAVARISFGNKTHLAFMKPVVPNPVEHDNYAVAETYQVVEV